MKNKRVFLVVLDSFGIGALPDASYYGDEINLNDSILRANTLRSVYSSRCFSALNLTKLGLFNIDGIDFGEKEENPIGEYGRIKELSKGKDTVTGHWEMCGIILDKSFPTFPNGFPNEIVDEFEKKTGKKTLCNKPYSGTEVIKDYGQNHIESGDLILYTSADSVFQLAAHEDVIPVNELYGYCETAREICDKYGIGRVIARPFIGEYPYTRTANRHDYAMKPPKKTLLDNLFEKGFDTIGIGKIYDIFAGCGISEQIKTKSNKDGTEKTIEVMKRDFNGLCFVNLVDFDSKYGHRNDIDGYANAISEFDLSLGEILNMLRTDDLLIITADHGCDPGFPTTDHTREYVPILVYGGERKPKNLGTMEGFSNIGNMIEKALLT